MSTRPGQEPDELNSSIVSGGTQSHRICVGSESVASQRETVHSDGDGVTGAVREATEPQSCTTSDLLAEDPSGTGG